MGRDGKGGGGGEEEGVRRGAVGEMEKRRVRRGKRRERVGGGGGVRVCGTEGVWNGWLVGWFVGCKTSKPHVRDGSA